jgi:uncharacterized protein (DUF885 family)
MNRHAPYFLPSSLLFVLLLVPGSAPAMPESAADRAFAKLAARFLDEYPSLYPVQATALGDHRFDGRLDEVTAAARARQLELFRGVLRDLEGIARGELSRSSQVDAAILENELRSSVWSLEELREWSWNPLIYTQLAGGAVYGLMARDFAPLRDRLVSVAARLEEFPRLLSEVRLALVPATVPKPHAETAVKQNRGVLGTIDELVKPRLGELQGAERSRLEKAIATATAAVEEHQKWLEAALLPAAAGDFRLGAERYDRKLAYTLGTALSRREIRARAEAELHSVREELYGIASGVYRAKHPYTKLPEAPTPEYKQAIIRAALEMAYAETPGRDQVIEAAKRSLELATAFVREKDLITVPPDPVEIIVMPEFQRGVALAYCDSPGPLETGQKTFYAVAPIPEDWTEEQVGSFLREYNLRSLHNLTVHEAMPGHFVQLAHSNRYPSTLRAVLSSGVFVEGWAVYTERMMVDEGFLDNDPLMRLVVRKWYLRGIANAIIDQAIHAGDMTREEALELMIEDTFQEEREAAAKWVRAQLTSTQLSTYFVGYLEHADLRREVEKAWGKDFRLKKYHDTLLSFGSPPVRFARALVLGLAVE